MRAAVSTRPRGAAWLLVAAAVGWLGLVVLLPLASVFSEAFAKGLGAFLNALKDPDAIAAIRLTLTISAVAVPLNALFGLAAAWTVTRFEFRGKSLLLSLIDVPFSLSPVISGLVWVLLFGANGWFGPQLEALGIKVIFNFTGILLATILVTLPFVARELIPLMQAQGADEELAAITLGAGGLQTFLRITLPNIGWALLYGVLLCNARAMGEFGAVSVVSGHIRGLTDTMPLHVEVLYNDYDFVGAFAVASLLAGLALVTLALKTWLEGRFAGELARGGRPTDRDSMSLSVTDISKRFARFPALNGVSLTAEPGEFLALLGPSGSGKTTLLRIVAGLETPDAGSVDFEGQDFLAMSPRERRVGMVFQHYALFRHMTVAKNIAFGLRVRPAKDRPKRTEIDKTVERLLSLIQLEGLGGRFPVQLSGGQQQRVALARALAIEPRMLLLDEPFGALDAKVRKDLRHWLRRVHDETGVTTIFVTHDQEEAMDIADRVVVLREGRIEQVGAPAALEEHPASAFVFDFLGDSNTLAGRVAGAMADFGGFTAPAVVQGGGGGETTAWFRPHDTLVEPDGEGLPVTVANILNKGAVVRLECRAADGTVFEADYPRTAPQAGFAIGTPARLRPKRVFVFAEAAGGRTR